MEQIRDSVPDTVHCFEEIWMKLSLGDVVIVNDNTKSEIDDVMTWLKGLDLDTPKTFCKHWNKNYCLGIFYWS
jgi:hypothetical protein